MSKKKYPHGIRENEEEPQNNRLNRSNPTARTIIEGNNHKEGKR